MPWRNAVTTPLASVVSPLAYLSITAAHNTRVPLSNSATKRILGNALVPRWLLGRPKARTFSAVSATSNVLPSRLTRRHCRYQAPLVRFSAIGATTASYSLFTGSDPSRVRAWEIPDLPATFNWAEGSSNHCTP